MQYLLPLVSFLISLFVLFDVISRDQSQIKNLSKITWVILVIILPLIGPILWFAVGREYADTGRGIALGSFGDPRRDTTYVAPTTEDDLAAVEREIEYHEKQASIRRLEAKLRDRRDGAPEV